MSLIDAFTGNQTDHRHTWEKVGEESEIEAMLVERQSIAVQD